MKPEGEQELSMDEIAKKLPSDLYDGISGTLDDVIEARGDREKGLLAGLRMAATEARSKGDFVTAERLDREAIELGRYFYSRAGTWPPK